LIEFPRSLARQLWAVFRRCVRKPYDRCPPVVEFMAHADGLRIRLPHLEVAVEFNHAGSYHAEIVCLPMTALADFEGRGPELVTLENGAENVVTARWTDGGVPQVVEYQAPDRDKQPTFPDLPKRFLANPPGLLNALDEAVQSTAQEGTRYAVQRLQLRGRSGEVVATDGRQLLVQGGFTFPWTEDVLVPRLGVFACRELGQGIPVEIGKTDKDVALRVGPWTIYLRIDSEARYPQVDQIIPKLKADTTHWRIAPEDAIFLARTLARLPGKDEDSQPLTVDLNGGVILRARAAGQGKATEIVLAHSDFTGKPVRFCMNRQFLARAIQLGFGGFYIPSADAPFVCRDDHRTFLAMPLPKDGAIAPSKDALRIVSTEGGPPPKASNPERKRVVMPTPTANGPGNGHGAPQRRVAQKPPENGHGTGSVVAEAQALKDVLRQCFKQASSFLAALKRQRKQSKLMQSTIATLRQLQQIDG
jgi:hypothetical protein